MPDFRGQEPVPRLAAVRDPEGLGQHAGASALRIPRGIGCLQCIKATSLVGKTPSVESVHIFGRGVEGEVLIEGETEIISGNLPASYLSHRFAQLKKDVVGRIDSNQSVPRIIEVEHDGDCQRDDHGKQHRVQPAASRPYRHGVACQHSTH